MHTRPQNTTRHRVILGQYVRSAVVLPTTVMQIITYNLGSLCDRAFNNVVFPAPVGPMMHTSRLRPIFPLIFLRMTLSSARHTKSSKTTSMAEDDDNEEEDKRSCSVYRCCGRVRLVGGCPQNFRNHTPNGDPSTRFSRELVLFMVCVVKQFVLFIAFSFVIGFGHVVLALRSGQRTWANTAGSSAVASLYEHCR